MDFIDPRHLLPLIGIGGTFAFAGSVLYGTWLLGRYRGRDDRTPVALADMEARLQRLEDAVSQATDAVDRLEAAHRLTARLLTDRVGERQSESSGRLPPRTTTPH